VTTPLEPARPWQGIVIASGDIALRALSQEQRRALLVSAREPEAVLPGDQRHFVTFLDSPEEIRQRVETEYVTPVTATVDDAWELSFGVLLGGDPVGMARLHTGGGWPSRRVVYSSSWLLRTHQGRGLGTSTRAGLLAFAFDWCRAEVARSHVLVENEPSQRVSRRLGYQTVAAKTFEEGDRLLTEEVLQVTRGTFRAAGPPTFTWFTYTA